MGTLLPAFKAIGAGLLTGIIASIGKLLTAELFEEIVLAMMGNYIDGQKIKAVKTPEKADDMRVARYEKVFVYIKEQWK